MNTEIKGYSGYRVETKLSGDMTVKWISVTDRLPRVMETVLLFVDAHTHPKHRFVSTGIRFPNGEFKWDRNAIIFPNAEVTHWMEIPKPPNGEKALELPEPEGLREPVRWFAELMEVKLRENDHKGGWQDCSLDWLVERLYEEAKELWVEIDRVEPEADQIVREATDVANFAMMIADNARRATSGEQKEDAEQ